MKARREVGPILFGSKDANGVQREVERIRIELDKAINKLIENDSEATYAVDEQKTAVA